MKKIRIMQVESGMSAVVLEKALHGELTLDSLRGMLNVLKELEAGIYVLEMVKDHRLVELAANIDGILMLPVKRVTKKRLEEIMKAVEGGEERDG
ncbi:MAG: hypothetical protein ACXQTI_02745 [Candidatus Nezhaarchaeales archaeon]